MRHIGLSGVRRNIPARSFFRLGTLRQGVRYGVDAYQGRVTASKGDKEPSGEEGRAASARHHTAHDVNIERGDEEDEMKSLSAIIAAVTSVAPAFAAEPEAITIGSIASRTGPLNVDSTGQERVMIFGATR